MNVSYQQETESQHDDEQALEIEDQNILSQVSGGGYKTVIASATGALAGAITGGIAGKKIASSKLSKHDKNHEIEVAGAAFGGSIVGSSIGVATVIGAKKAITAITAQATRQPARIAPVT